MLQKAKMKLVSREECLDQIPQLPKDMLCVELQQGSCQVNHPLGWPHCQWGHRDIHASHGFIELLKLLCIRPGQEAQRPRICLSVVQKVHIDPNTVIQNSWRSVVVVWWWELSTVWSALSSALVQAALLCYQVKYGQKTGRSVQESQSKKRRWENESRSV